MDEYRDIIQAAKNQVGKAKTQIELNLVRDIKGNKMDFYKYVSDERKSRENVGPLMKEMENLVTQDIEKAEILSDFFCLSLLAIALATLSNSQNTKAGTARIKYYPLKEKIKFKTI